MLAVSLGNGKNMNQGRRAGGLHHQAHRDRAGAHR
jgi:hypothetical protein